MTFSSHYQTNSAFPYKRPYKKNTYKSVSSDASSFPAPEKEKSFSLKNLFDFSFLQPFLAPVEKLIGRKVCFDDLLLLVVIYLVFTEKETEDKTLLLCLLFILID